MCIGPGGRGRRFEDGWSCLRAVGGSIGGVECVMFLAQQRYGSYVIGLGKALKCRYNSTLQTTQSLYCPRPFI